jgi:hypothetical protein
VSNHCWQDESRKEITVICPECNGSTYCQLCEGKGYIDGGIVGGILSPLPGDDVSECEKCGGDGKCPNCDGSGEVDEEE